MKSNYCNVKRYEGKGEDNLQTAMIRLSHEVPFWLGIFLFAFVNSLQISQGLLQIFQAN